MNDLFAPAIPAADLLSDRFRIHAVTGDRLSPRLRSGFDYVLLAPIDRYAGEGVYLLHDGVGPSLFRVSASFDKAAPLRLSGDNPLYSDHLVSAETFRENVLGIVVADIKVQDERFLRGQS